MTATKAEAGSRSLAPRLCLTLCFGAIVTRLRPVMPEFVAGWPALGLIAAVFGLTFGQPWGELSG
ncbi:MAG: hypothetical protein ACK4RZ_16780 [Paracoccaceae bacterium]